MSTQNNSEIVIGDTQLTDRDKETLSVITQIESEKQHPPTATEIRERIIWMKQPSQSSYRLSKLEELELIETGTVSNNTDRPDRVTATITTYGNSIIDDHNLKTYANPETLTRRINKLEAQNQSLKQQLQAHQAVLTEIERVFSDLGVTMDTKQIMRESIEK